MQTSGPSFNLNIINVDQNDTVSGFVSDGHIALNSTDATFYSTSAQRDFEGNGTVTAWNVGDEVVPASSNYDEGCGLDALESSAVIKTLDQLAIASRVFPNGTIITRQWRITDLCGKETVVSQTVTYEDNQAPVIALLGDNPQEIEQFSIYQELEATAIDDVDGDISSEISIDGSAVDTEVLGNYQVTYNVADRAGNHAVEVIRTVTVVEGTSGQDAILEGIDSDRDGVFDATEEQAGTDALDPSDYLHVTQMVIRNNQLVLEWPGKRARAYQIEYSVDLFRQSWDVIGTTITASRNETARFVDVRWRERARGKQGFYRIRIDADRDPRE